MPTTTCAAASGCRERRRRRRWASDQADHRPALRSRARGGITQQEVGHGHPCRDPSTRRPRRRQHARRRVRGAGTHHAPGTPDPRVRTQRRPRPRRDDDDLRHRRAHPARRVPGRSGAHRRPRARRRHRPARLRGRGLRGRRPRAGRRHQPVRHVLLLPEPRRGAVLRPRRRVGDDRRLAPRQLDRRRPGRLLPRARTRRPTSPRSPTT